MDDLYTASYDRSVEWRQCCLKAKGFDWVDDFDDDTKEVPNAGMIQQVINLMEEEEKVDEELLKFRKQDPWTENALRIQADLTRMAQWILAKQHEYISLDMGDEEASLIQSTVTSFAATTASELETLRKIIPNSMDNVARHRAGVVQILLAHLQQAVTEPFGRLQKQRTRVAVQLWQNPWQCKLHQRPQKGGDSMMQMLDDDDAAYSSQLFVPRRQLPEQNEFLANYMDGGPSGELPPRPDFMDRLANARAQEHDPTLPEESASTRPDSPPQRPVLQPILAPPVPPTILPYQQPTSEEARQQFENDMEEEAAMLAMDLVHHDLDSVQKMEQRMVEITTLIGQFSNLVTEQQEDIHEISQNAEKTKDNMDKGQDNLVDATERTKQSKHYMAWMIFVMSVILLFFHTLRN